MSQELILLSFTAVSVGLIHTLLGPDHYLPFLAMARAGKWPLAKTMWITFWCGLAHIASSVLLGLIGIVFGVAVYRLEAVEAFRGHIAAWALIAFGLMYAVWGLREVFRNQSHTHWHAHGEGAYHAHEHVHEQEHVHVHILPSPSPLPAGEGKGEGYESRTNLTPWILFAIFVFGPCEPLIPILMVPAARNHFWELIWVTALFGLTTIAVMLAVVASSFLGLKWVSFGRWERFSHVFAGGTVLLCGLAIQLLGL